MREVLGYQQNYDHHVQSLDSVEYAREFSQNMRTSHHQDFVKEINEDVETLAYNLFFLLQLQQ